MDLFDKSKKMMSSVFRGLHFCFLIKYTIFNGFFQILKPDARQEVEATGGRNSTEPRINGECVASSLCKNGDKYVCTTSEGEIKNQGLRLITKKRGNIQITFRPQKRPQCDGPALFHLVPLLHPPTPFHSFFRVQYNLFLCTMSAVLWRRTNRNSPRQQN